MYNRQRSVQHLQFTDMIDLEVIIKIKLRLHCKLTDAATVRALRPRKVSDSQFLQSPKEFYYYFPIAFTDQIIADQNT